MFFFTIRNKNLILNTLQMNELIYQIRTFEHFYFFSNLNIHYAKLRNKVLQNFGKSPVCK